MGMKSEHEEQRELVRWFRQTYSPVRIFAIPNGGARSISTATRLKVEGVSAGVPDLFVPKWTMWIEMKREKNGRISPEQKDWIAYLESINHVVIIGYGCNDAKEKIKLYNRDNK
jgi:hypothetical protein